MKRINNKIRFLITFLFCISTAYLSWLSFRSVDIVAVHQRHSFSDVLVKNFPLTDRGKIAWWLKNKERLKASYGIPKPFSDGSFTITFWLFGDGYKELEKYDRLCFADMKQKENCIEKDPVFAVHNYRGKRTVLTVYDGNYLLKENGEVVKFEYR